MLSVTQSQALLTEQKANEAKSSETVELQDYANGVPNADKAREVLSSIQLSSVEN